MVTVTPIRTEEEFQLALRELDRVWGSAKGTKDHEVFKALGDLIEEYEDKHFPMDEPDPIEAIKFRMEQQGMSQTDLAKIIGYDSRVSEVLNRKRKLTLPMIRKLSKSLQIDAGLLIQEYDLNIQGRITN